MFDQKKMGNAIYAVLGFLLGKAFAPTLVSLLDSIGGVSLGLDADQSGLIFGLVGGILGWNAAG